MADSTIQSEIDEFRFHFDAMYIGGIPRLLNEDGAYLSFLVALTAIDSLAGVYAPKSATGERFRTFVERFFAEPLSQMSAQLWSFRNLMVHAFNPGPFALVVHQSRLHLTRQGDAIVLNAEDLYAALIGASRKYFDALTADHDLQARFAVRLAEDDGGTMQSWTVVR